MGAIRAVTIGLSDFARDAAAWFSASRNGAECRSDAARTRAATSASDMGGGDTACGVMDGGVTAGLASSTLRDCASGSCGSSIWASRKAGSKGAKFFCSPASNSCARTSSSIVR